MTRTWDFKSNKYLQCGNYSVQYVVAVVEQTLTLTNTPADSLLSLLSLRICMYRHTVACHTHDRFFDVTICVRMDMLSSYRDAQERLSLNKRCVMRAVHEWASRGHQFCDHGLTCDDRWSFSAHPSIHPKVIQNPSINLPTHSSVLIPWIDDKHCSLAL